MKPPPKRVRKSKSSFQHLQISKNPDTSTSATTTTTVRIIMLGPKTKKGRFGARHFDLDVEKPVELPPAPQDIIEEDPNAFDAAQWHDMLEDNVIHVAKRKRKQRNDSVSYLLCRYPAQLNIRRLK